MLINDFRIFYNHTIHPELLRMERRRKQLLFLFFIILILISVIIFLQIYYKFWMLTILLMLPLAVYMSYLFFKIRKFITTFKPNVVNLILDFIDNTVNFGTLTYDSKKSISKEEFFASHIFGDKADIYDGEDYIEGKVGELDFEMCELDVEVFSSISGEMKQLFKGIFLHTTFNENIKGEIIVIPKKERQFFTRSIKMLDLKMGINLDNFIILQRFKNYFTAYGTEQAKAHGLLSLEMQKAMINYKEKTGRDIYFSFIDNDIYIAVKEPKDILEPYIFRSNVNFDLILDFYERIKLLISIVQDFDASH